MPPPSRGQRRRGDDGGLPKTRETHRAGKGHRRRDRWSPLIPPSFLICLSGIIGRRIKGLPLVKGACERARREPISIGRCQESDAAAVGRRMNRLIDRLLTPSTIGPSICLTISPYRRRMHFIHEMQIPETAKFAASKSRSGRTRRREREAPVCACVRKAARPYARPRSVRSLIRFAEAERGEGRTKETLVVTVAHNVCSRSNSSQKGSDAAVFLASGKCSP